MMTRINRKTKRGLLIYGSKEEFSLQEKTSYPEDGKLNMSNVKKENLHHIIRMLSQEISFLCVSALVALSLHI